MSKKKIRIPKQVLGYKIPKSIRKSFVINSMLASKARRELAAAALTAAATAAAGVLIGERKEIGKAAKEGAKETGKAANIVSRAMERAFEAALAELNLLPKKQRKEVSRRSFAGAPVH